MFFERVLTYLDAERDRGSFGSPTAHPVFAAISTSSHHMWFDGVPASERRIYPDPKNREETFASSLHASDRYIGSFLEALARRPWAKEALVVLVGDHGYPAGEHGNFVNAIGAWEENFRTPLVLWSPGWLAPRNIDDRAHSQVDLMPTLLDLLGVDASAHMAGESIVATRTGPANPELLIQPYDGRQLVSLRYPYKLVRHVDTDQESLFDLARGSGRGARPAAGTSGAAAPGGRHRTRDATARFPGQPAAHSIERVRASSRREPAALGGAWTRLPKGATPIAPGSQARTLRTTRRSCARHSSHWTRPAGPAPGSGSNARPGAASLI